MQKKVDILFGDFNIDAISNEAYADIDKVLPEYVLMVIESTHLYGGLLDHMYLRKQFLMGKHANSKVNNIYFSDHDAVKTHIQKEKLEDDKEIDFTVS